MDNCTFSLIHFLLPITIWPTPTIRHIHVNIPKKYLKPVYNYTKRKYTLKGEHGYIRISGTYRINCLMTR